MMTSGDTMFKILVVEDHENTMKLISSILKAERYTVFKAYNSEEAFDILSKENIDCILLDLMLPGLDGFEITRQIRKTDEETPILILTAKQLQEDKKTAFIAGCDDYLIKPFDNDELLLRIKALLRRSNKLSLMQIKIGKVLLDYASLSFQKEDIRLTLPQKEFYLLYKLAGHPNRIFTRLELIEEIWGNNENADSTLNVHIMRLRKKLENFPEIELITIRDLGYKAVLHEEK